MDRQTALSTIRLLSLFLHESGIPIPRDRSTDNELSPLNNMFTLLNIGSSSSLIVTVTGQISPDEFLVTVVISSNSSALMQPTISATMVNSAILHPVQLVQARSAVICASYLESICFMMFMEHLRLPGSHGRAVPWDPSSSGILDEILAKLAQKLRQDVLNLAIKNASMTIDKSRQSSPASGSISIWAFTLSERTHRRSTPSPVNRTRWGSIDLDLAMVDARDQSPSRRGPLRKRYGDV
ncbi:hypothetical protein ABKN59_007744 [Abortiporus biennis]